MHSEFWWGLLVGMCIGVGAMLIVLHKQGAANAKAIADGIASGIARVKRL